MGVVNLPGGKPSLRLTGGALRRLEEITPPGHKAQIDLTITDDFPLAQAIVIISAVAAGDGGKSVWTAHERDRRKTGSLA